MNSSWRLLPVATGARVPPLLVATSFGPASYSVAVTDLVRVWSESLDRRAICMRALQANTTIDPSYDSEQMGVFLEKLESVFNFESASESSLSLAADADTSGDGLALHISCALPGDLPPLTWIFHLSLQSPDAIASLVQPLVRDRARSQRSSAALVSALRQKDVVIAKLAEKLDAIGAGVESAFPSIAPSSSGGGGAANPRRAAAPRMSRADIERRIKGLQPFDESAFLRQQKQIESADDTTSLPLSTIFGELPCGTDFTETENRESASWWQSLGKVAITRAASAANSQGTLQSEGPAKGPDEDGFQTTPSNATKHAKSLESSEGSGNSDPVREPPSPTPPKSPTTSKSAKPKGLGRIGRLGGIGKNKEAKKEAEIVKPKLVSSPPAVGADNDDTASEAEPEAGETGETKGSTDRITDKRRDLDESMDDNAGVKTGNKTKTVAAVRPKTRGGLGRISGKKEKKAEPREQTPEMEKPEEPVQQTPEKEPAKRKIDNNESPAVSKAQPPGLASHPPPESISETKRAEILQHAVAKNAAPSRKKRKF